jgi:putative transcriptional regulator
MKTTYITTKILSDGSVVQVMPDGTEVPMQVPALQQSQPLEDAEDEITPERFAKMRLVPRSKTLRRALGLTQEEFAARYRIPIGTLRDWEQGRTEPDATSRAYLHVIAKNPEMVMQALAS